MKLLYISGFMFAKQDGRTFALPSCSDKFFQKYLDVFTDVRVLGEPMKKYLDPRSFVTMTDKRISVRILKANKTPRDFVYDREIKKQLCEEIANSEAVLIKPSSRKGMMAIRIAKQLEKPYMIELTGDIHNALSQGERLLGRIYAPFLYRQIKHSICDCKFGLYVSDEYLQRRYPIVGKTCGCSNVVIPEIEDEVLRKRLKRIEEFNVRENVNVALVGFYNGLRKGVDVAIRALSELPPNFRLSILGNGTEENRFKWIDYGRRLGIVDRISFPSPLSSSLEVLYWLESQDFFILPARSEGLPRCLIEAISVGCPSFASNVCAIPEILPRENLFEVGDAKKLASLLRSYASNTELMKESAKSNFERAKKYRYELILKRRNQFLTEFRQYACAFNQNN